MSIGRSSSSSMYDLEKFRQARQSPNASVGSRDPTNKMSSCLRFEYCIYNEFKDGLTFGFFWSCAGIMVKVKRVGEYRIRGEA